MATSLVRVEDVQGEVKHFSVAFYYIVMQALMLTDISLWRYERGQFRILSGTHSIIFIQESSWCPTRSLSLSWFGSTYTEIGRRGHLHQKVLVPWWFMPSASYRGKRFMVCCSWARNEEGPDPRFLGSAIYGHRIGFQKASQFSPTQQNHNDDANLQDIGVAGPPDPTESSGGMPAIEQQQGQVKIGKQQGCNSATFIISSCSDGNMRLMKSTMARQTNDNSLGLRMNYKKVDQHYARAGKAEVNAGTVSVT
ncbi:hypothetical protein OPV22_015525 [Ensete ventricosum]|uniref:Uncharacterized protein n=1 Tax=Ensete ventricosum TaxID=4639 RepID=A0AAV8PT19_ENSVE|nr:hypothetical protein OPV22_015525 [Ensete ventricosum]